MRPACWGGSGPLAEARRAPSRAAQRWRVRDGGGDYERDVLVLRGSPCPHIRAVLLHACHFGDDERGALRARRPAPSRAPDRSSHRRALHKPTPPERRITYSALSHLLGYRFAPGCVPSYIPLRASLQRPIRKANRTPIAMNAAQESSEIPIIASRACPAGKGLLDAGASCHNIAFDHRAANALMLL
jgi:hypothetical protein